MIQGGKYVQVKYINVKHAKGRAGILSIDFKNSGAHLSGKKAKHANYQQGT